MKRYFKKLYKDRENATFDIDVAYNSLRIRIRVTMEKEQEKKEREKKREILQRQLVSQLSYPVTSSPRVVRFLVSTAHYVR